MLRNSPPLNFREEDLFEEVDPSETIGTARAALLREAAEMAETAKVWMEQEFRRDPMAHWVFAEETYAGDIAPVNLALCEWGADAARHGRSSCRSATGNGHCPNCCGVSNDAADGQLRVLCNGNVLRDAEVGPGQQN